MRITLRDHRQKERERVINEIKNIIKNKEYISKDFLIKELNKLK